MSGPGGPRAGKTHFISREFLALDSFGANTAQKRVPMDTTTLVARRERALGTGAPLFYDRPLHVAGGGGVYLCEENVAPGLDVYTTVRWGGNPKPHVGGGMSRQQP